MRILIHGLNFAPELVGVGKYTGEMAEWLAARGHEVRVVTAPPFNPAWRVAPNYSPWRYYRENGFCGSTVGSLNRDLIEVTGGHSKLQRATASASALLGEKGVLVAEEADVGAEVTNAGSLAIFRCPVWVPQRPSAARRLLHLASFALSSLWIMLRQVRWYPEVVLVVEPSLFCAPNARICARLSGAKSWLHIQDFEVDAAFEFRFLTSSLLWRWVRLVEKRCMSDFDRVSTISEKMMMQLRQKGVEHSRCVLFPNWVDTDLVFPLQRPSPMRTEMGIPDDVVVALYSGNLAYKQGLDVLAEAARKLQFQKGLRFIFCGDGPAKTSLAKLANQLENVQFLPLQPLEKLNDLLNLADIHLLPQRADAADLVMPSKLTGMLASGRPIVATARIGTQVAKVVSGRGLVVPPEDVSAFACAIDQLANDPLLRDKLGRSARAYAISNLEKGKVLSGFEQDLMHLVSSTSAGQLSSNCISVVR